MQKLSSQQPYTNVSTSNDHSNIPINPVVLTLLSVYTYTYVQKYQYIVFVNE